MPVEKYLLALGCLNAALAIDAQHPALHVQAIELAQALKKDAGSLPAQAQEVVKADFTAVPASADLQKLNLQFQEQHSQDAQHRIAAVRTSRLLGEDAVKTEKDLFDVLSLPSATFHDAASALALLRSWRSSQAESFKQAAHEKWPGVTRFA